MSTAEDEIAKAERFAFGENWSRFLTSLTDARIRRAETSLKEVLGTARLNGRRFLDVGCGSGLFSLAAMNLGAEVHSFDYDQDSVSCTRELKRRYHTDDDQWVVEQGSVLDSRFLQGLGQWDVVYAWGVLHHTGDMWQALDNVVPLVRAQGRLCIAIYNDQGRTSRRWMRIKQWYNAHRWMRGPLLLYTWVIAWGVTVLLDTIRLHPFKSWNLYFEERGMSAWHDLIDWAGGWPFEVATPEQVFAFYRDRGFSLINLITRQGRGCNEFVLQRTADVDEGVA